MKEFFNNHSNLSLWLFFFILATFILFFISPDSYFNDLHSRIDSAWFFMCGKAWMSGLVPYVDFADSKGPLLWLIYGIGYLLSPTNYIGVYWISCFWYSLIFFFTYKTAIIFLLDKKRAILCSILMSLAFFNPWFHDEIRAEDFSILFLVISLYEMCRLAWTNHRPWNRCFFVLGTCFGALLMIKFNIAAMQAIIILACIIVLIREHSSFFPPILYCIGGFLTIIAPFMIYFMAKGNFTSFIQEYFINTLSTIAGLYSDYSPNLLLRTQQQFSDNPIITYIFEWAGVIYEPEVGALFILILLGGYLWGQKLTSYKYLPLLVSLFIFALAIKHHFYYYFTSCSPCIIFLILYLLSLPKRFSSTTTYSLSLFVVLCCIITHFLLFNFKCVFFNNNKNQIDFYTVASCIHEKKNPTILYAGGGECGFGVTEKVLPAGKYWSLQYGANDRMKQEHKELVLSGKSDFIVVIRESFLNSIGISYDDIDNAGYHTACYFGENDTGRLFSKSE